MFLWSNLFLIREMYLSAGLRPSAWRPRFRKPLWLCLVSRGPLTKEGGHAVTLLESVPHPETQTVENPENWTPFLPHPFLWCSSTISEAAGLLSFHPLPRYCYKSLQKTTATIVVRVRVRVIAAPGACNRTREGDFLGQVILSSRFNHYCKVWLLFHA